MLNRSDGFIWGTATASYQIEGAAAEDGRGESIWDRFSHISGNTANGDTGDVACDHYHRFEEDIKLMVDLGVKAYRYSIAWPRIQPAGSGKINQKGIDFYRRLTETLLRYGIRPYVTMYHWDLPQALEESGGWASRETAERFADYAQILVDSLPDVKDWMTLNEPWVVACHGYQQGIFAPGRREDPATMAAVIHNLLLAHGYGVGAVRAADDPDMEVGIVLDPVLFLPASQKKCDVDARDRVWARENDWWLDPLYLGRYPAGTWLDLDGARPEILDGDMEIISSPTDFLGLNVYCADSVEADPLTNRDKVFKPDCDLTDMGWPVTPECIYEAIRKISQQYNLNKIYITENGAAYPDEVSADGCIHDVERVVFLHRYIDQVKRAYDEGLPVRGYFAWSLLDNFEWAEGYAKRFGLVYVDYKDGLRRIPKDSFYYYKSVVSADARQLSTASV